MGKNNKTKKILSFQLIEVSHKMQNINISDKLGLVFLVN